jgi:phenylpropionate dioxygenase-like ring-hydroxylating dioxygenase large terminal subunit
MMGTQATPERLFYDYCLEDHVPDDHLLRRVATYTREDIAILERLQAGRASSGYDGGRFSSYHEQTTHQFQKLVARTLNGGNRPVER